MTVDPGRRSVLAHGHHSLALGYFPLAPAGIRVRLERWGCGEQLVVITAVLAPVIKAWRVRQNRNQPATEIPSTTAENQQAHCPRMRPKRKMLTC